MERDPNVEKDQEYARQVASGEASGIVEEYIVEERDTLEDIARKYNISLEAIVAANSDIIRNQNDLVQPGLQIKIPRHDRK